MNSYDHYKNLREEDAMGFDSEWGTMAQKIGFNSSLANNKLGYGYEDA